MKSYRNRLLIILALIVFTSVQSYAQKDTTVINSVEALDVLEENESDMIFIHVQQMPEFPGGIPALRRWFGENVEFPTGTRENGICATYYLRFVVTKHGDVEKFKIEACGTTFKKDAIKLIKSLPKFKPGEHNGKKVNVWFNIPINITLR